MTLKSPLKGLFKKGSAGKSDKSTASSDGSSTSYTSNNQRLASTPKTAKYSTGSTSTAETAPMSGFSRNTKYSKSAPGRTKTKVASSVREEDDDEVNDRLDKIPLPLYDDDDGDNDFPEAAASPKKNNTVKVRSKASSSSKSPSSKSKKIGSKLKSPKAKKATGVTGGVKKTPKKKGKRKVVGSKNDSPTKASTAREAPDDRRDALERTWSIGAFSAAVSVGENTIGDNTIGTVLYVEDASSYYESDDSEYDDEDDDLLHSPTTTKKKKKKKKKVNAKSTVRRLTKKQHEKQRAAEQRAAAALRALSLSPTKKSETNAEAKASPFLDSHTLTSPSSSKKSKKSPKKGRKAARSKKQGRPMDEISFDSEDTDDEELEEYGEEAGYSSDGPFSRKKKSVPNRKSNKKNRGSKNNRDVDDSNDGGVIIDFEFQKIEGDGKRSDNIRRGLERRNSTGTIGSSVTEETTWKLDKNDAIAALRAAAARAAAEEEARAAAAADSDSDDGYLMDDDEQERPQSMASLPMTPFYDSSTDDIVGGSRAGKEDAQKKLKELDDYFKQVDNSDDPDLLQGEYGCGMSVATGRSAIEALENLLEKSKKEEIQKEREAMAFERESLELQLSDEVQKNEELSMQILELEQQLQSQQYSNSNDVRGQQDWENEKEELMKTHEREKNELSEQLVFKDREIEDLERTVKEFELLQEKNGLLADDSEGKSKERLQGELLQAQAKLAQKEARLEEQTHELEQIKAELAELALGAGVETLKEEIEVLKEDKRQVEEKWDAEKKDNEAKLKDKDDTITYLMGELAKLKQEQSKASGSIGGSLYPRRNSNSSFSGGASDLESSLSRRGASLLSSLGFNNSNTNLQMEKD